MNRINSKAAHPGDSSIPVRGTIVSAAMLRGSRQGIPGGECRVDAEALRRARQGTPTGEYHWSEALVEDEFHLGPIGRPYPPECCCNCGGFHPPQHCRAVPSVS